MLHLGRPGLARKHWTRKGFARDKHSSLLRKSINYCYDKFYSTGPRRNLYRKINYHNGLYFVTLPLMTKSIMTHSISIKFYFAECRIFYCNADCHYAGCRCA